MTINTDFTVVFNPTNRTLDFSSWTNFDIRRLIRVFNITRNVVMYQLPDSDNQLTSEIFKQNSFAANILTLNFPTSGYNSNDILIFDYATSSGSGTTVDVSSSALPTGASTSARQDTGNTSLANIAISAAASATSAKQDTGNTSLGNIDANLGAKADAAATTDSGTFSVISLIKRGLQNWTNLLAKIPSLGQAAAAGAIPVTLSNENIQDLFITGQSAQTAVVNNILSTTAGANATDATGYRSAMTQVVSTATGGTFIFEGCNDNVNFQPIPVYNQNILTGTPTTAAITPTASSIGYIFPTNFRYIRLRIVTAITGGSIQAFSKLMQTPFAPAVNQIAQNTAGNLNTTSVIASGTITSVTTLANGQTAHSSASTGSPVRVGGRVNTTLDTSLVQGDASDLMQTSAGQVIQKPFGSAENDWQYAAAASGIVNTTTAVTIKAAGAASIRNFITGITIMAEALGAATELVIRDGAAGTVIWRTKIPATGLPTTNIQFPTPLKGTAATLLEVATLTASVTGGVFFNAQGYQSF